MALDKEQISDLLGLGLSNDMVASTVGCEAAYITQLMAQEQFAAIVIAKRTKALMSNNKRDASIDEIEDTLIEKLSETVSYLTKPSEILHAFRYVNAAKRRGVPAHESLTIQNTVVNLTIPEQLVKNFTINPHGEVIEAGSQTLVTMQAHTLMTTLASGGSANAEHYEKVRRYLPGPSSSSSKEGSRSET